MCKVYCYLMLSSSKTLQIKLKIKYLSLINRLFFLISQHHINALNVQSIYRSNNPNVKKKERNTVSLGLATQ